MATVILTPQAQADFAGLPLTIRARVEKVLVRLQQWPNVSGVKALRGRLAGRYRARTGDYRVQFTVPRPDLVVVEKIGHRDGFYDD